MLPRIGCGYGVRPLANASGFLCTVTRGLHWGQFSGLNWPVYSLWGLPHCYTLLIASVVRFLTLHNNALTPFLWFTPFWAPGKLILGDKGNFFYRRLFTFLVSIRGRDFVANFIFTTLLPSGLGRVIGFHPNYLYQRSWCSLHSCCYSRPSSPHKCGVGPGTWVRGKFSGMLGVL